MSGVLDVYLSGERAKVAISTYQDVSQDPVVLH